MRRKFIISIVLGVLLACSLASADNKLRNASFNQTLENGDIKDFVVYGKIAKVPENDRAAKGDVIILEGGVTQNLAWPWKEAEGGMLKLSVRYRHANDDCTMALVATVNNKNGYVTDIRAQPESPDENGNVVYSALIPVASDVAQLSIWCQGSQKQALGIDQYRLEPMTQYQIHQLPPTPKLIACDSETEPLQSWIQFREYAANSKGAVLERSEDGKTFAAISRAMPYAHSVADPDARPGMRYQYRLKNMSDAGASEYSNIITTQIPAWIFSRGSCQYYIDSANGNDSATGLDPKAAWKSLERASHTIFAPGDQILLKRGSSWQGFLELRGSGTKEKPIRLRSYGDGPLPAIQANHLFAVRLRNQQNWDITDLQLSNSQEVAPDLTSIKTYGATLRRGDPAFLSYARQQWRMGLLIQLENYGVAENIHIGKLVIQDIQGAQNAKENGGIVVDINGYIEPSRFNNLVIDSCELYQVCRTGIVFRVNPHAQRDHWFPSTNVRITNNRLREIGGDGIVPWACDGCVIADNVVYRAACTAYDPNVAIWPWSCDNTLVTRNTAACTVKNPGNGDGQGYDIDTNNHNTIVENNLSYQNGGGFILICANPGEPTCNSIVRNNISIGDSMSGISLWYDLRGVKIYNNTLIVPDDAKMVYLIANWGKGTADPVQMKDVEFFNNIVVAETPLAFRGVQTSWRIHHNLFWGMAADGLIGAGEGNLKKDPRFSGKFDPLSDITDQLKKLCPSDASGGALLDRDLALKGDYFGARKVTPGRIGAVEPAGH